MAVDSLHALPYAVRVTLTMFAIVSAMSVALLMTLRGYRHDRTPYKLLDVALWLTALAQMLACILIMAQVQLNNAAGELTAPGPYAAGRYAVFTVTVILFTAHLVIKNPLIPLTVLAAATLTLPFMEVWAGALYPAAFAVSLIITFALSIWLTLTSMRELKSSISGLSVMQAIDSLNTAVLFFREDGHILLINDRMREIMIRLGGRVLFNGKHFLETFVIPSSEKPGGFGEESGNYLYHHTDGDWLFSVKKDTLGRSPITHLFATDVTEQYKINLKLRDNQQQLIMQQTQLRELVGSVEDICRSEELLRLKAALHDEHNQKMTVLLHYLRAERPIGEDIIPLLEIGQTHGIRDKTSQTINPGDELTALIGGYEQVGVRITLDNVLPADDGKAFTLINILREAAANAVIHGYASEIVAKITEDSQGGIVMDVADNSSRSPVMEREGTGIADMRRRLALYDGNLTIDATGGFKLTATIPKTG